MTSSEPPPPAEQTTGLNDLIEKSKAQLADMSEEERQAMWQAQRESFVRAMTTPCEHGVLDFEQCPQCRAPAPAEHVVGTEAVIRKAGQVAIDALIDRWSGTMVMSNDDMADYMTRIVDACVRAALSASEVEE